MEKYVPNAAQAALHAIRGQNRVHTFVGGRGAGATTALLMDPVANGFTAGEGYGLYVCRNYSQSVRAFNFLRESAPGNVPLVEQMRLKWLPRGFNSVYQWRSDELIRAILGMRFDHIAIDDVDDMSEEDFVGILMCLRGENERMVVSCSPHVLIGDTWQNRRLANRVIAQEG